MKTITAKMLEDKRACADQVALFRKTFPRGCRLTLENVEKALKVGLWVEWAVREFATRPHWAAYRAAIKPHLDAYYAAIKPHLDAYYAAIKPHLDAFDAAIKPHLAAYDAAITKEALKALLGEDDP